MKVYTGQLITEKEYPGHALDITVKSARGIGAILAPTWDMVLGHKRCDLSDAEYTERYLNLLRGRYKTYRADFHSIFSLAGTVTLLCYCRSGNFCHRHIAVDVLEKIAGHNNLELIRMGEVGVDPALLEPSIYEPKW